MPTKNHRVNLTIPDSVWNDLLIVQKRHFDLPMASICLCLIKQRLEQVKGGVE